MISTINNAIQNIWIKITIQYLFVFDLWYVAVQIPLAIQFQYLLHSCLRSRNWKWNGCLCNMRQILFLRQFSNLVGSVQSLKNYALQRNLYSIIKLTVLIKKFRIYSCKRINLEKTYHKNMTLQMQLLCWL